MAGETAPLWVRNGPDFPYDLCFDFEKSRVLVLSAGSLARGHGYLGSFLGGGRRALKGQYELLQELTIEERLSADTGSLLIPFSSVVRVTLAKPWGRAPVLILATALEGQSRQTSNGDQYVMRREFSLSSNRKLQSQQISEIREVLSRSDLGTKFEDRTG
ncbi:MAG: hypothetical protein JRN21_00625 [Nitrososphaerota archaeon]|nr:hypothetical protein [Nitrososphaerota archaeon]